MRSMITNKIILIKHLPDDVYKEKYESDLNYLKKYDTLLITNTNLNKKY